MNQLIDLRPRTGVWRRRGRTIVLDDPFAADTQQTETRPPMRGGGAGGDDDYVGNLPPGPRKRVPGVLSITAYGPSPGERTSAEWLRDKGFTLVLRDPTGSLGGLGTSDIVVNDQIWDIYVPQSRTSLENIINKTSRKRKQATGVLVNLIKTRFTLEDVRRALHNLEREGSKNPLRTLRYYVFFRRG